LGEPQILGQVTHALELALRQGAAGPLLSRLFQSAIHAGKRVRSETAIAQNPASIPSLAVRLALEVFPHLDRVRVAVLGAGDMAEALVESLHKRGAGHITVVNRTLERARLLARRWEAAATTFQDLEAVLADADLLIASTGAPHTLISAQQVSVLMQARPGRPLLVIDIAVPRDVEAAVAQVPGAQMYDLDALQSYLEQHLAVRQGEVPEAEAILEAELAGFMEFLEAQEVLSVIKTMRQQAEAIRQAELEKTFRHLPDLTPAERQRIEALTAALIGKLLHTPTARLRAEAQRSRAGEFTSVARSLFGIEPPARDYDAR
jgi:glutamyl-tRNA reductase